MKKVLHFIVLMITTTGIFFSCEKESSCEGCKGNKPPIAVAGPDQVITLPADSISLDGSASNDPDGKISEWLWTKISGPASFAIANATSAKTLVKNLAAGAYKFELTVTDDKSASAKDTMQLIVNDLSQPPNHPPVANAGNDTTITLPANTANLDGSKSTDPDNNITTYQWTKISGPSSFNIANSNAAQTQVTNLVEGVYQFELKVTDAGGLNDKDTMKVTGNAPPPPLNSCPPVNRPIINAQLIPIGTLSQARIEMAVASAGNKIVFAGGWKGTQFSETTRIDIFDIATNTWSTAELTLCDGGGRIWAAAATAGNKIFIAGGQNDGSSCSNVDIYDVSTNTWTISNLSRAADGLAAAAVGDKVFFAGGNWGIYAVSTVDIYNLTTNTWSTVSLSTPRNFITAVSANNKVYFTGGDLWTGQMSNVIDIYDNSTGTWSTSSLQTARAYHAAIALNDVLYFAGGDISSNNPGYYTATCSVETLNTSTGARALMNLNTPASWQWVCSGQNAVVKDNKLIFLTSGDKFDIYDTQNNAWLIGVLPQPIPGGASVVSINNTIYIAGGLVNGVPSSQVWKLEF